MGNNPSERSLGKESTTIGTATRQEGLSFGARPRTSPRSLLERHPPGRVRRVLRRTVAASERAWFRPTNTVFTAPMPPWRATPCWIRGSAWTVRSSTPTPACVMRNPTMSPSRWAVPICTAPSIPRAGEPRSAATSATPSVIGSRSGSGRVPADRGACRARRFRAGVVGPLTSGDPVSLPTIPDRFEATGTDIAVSITRIVMRHRIGLRRGCGLPIHKPRPEMDAPSARA